MNFIRLAADDPRVRHVHVTLFTALCFMWQKAGFVSPLPAVRRELMHYAKIGSRGTYNTCMNELHEYGYIRYEPEADPRKKSRVWMGELA